MMMNRTGHVNSPNFYTLVLTNNLRHSAIVKMRISVFSKKNSIVGRGNCNHYINVSFSHITCVTCFCSLILFILGVNLRSGPLLAVVFVTQVFDADFNEVVDAI